MAFWGAFRPASLKLFEGSWNDWAFCEELKRVLPKDCIILARDHPLSEQKDDMWRDPVGTGRRHANEWKEKVDRGQYWMETERSYFLGINEPDATNGDRGAIDRYTVAFLDTLRSHGLKGGAFNFSTGHPRTHDGTATGRPDYSVFENSHQAIVRGRHIAVMHIYGTAEEPLVPGHFDRIRHCPWTDVTWVIGECGIDQHVIGGGAHTGYLWAMEHPGEYPAWLERLIRGTNDLRIHSWQPFTWDFHHPWASFDVRAVNAQMIDWKYEGMPVYSGGNTPQPEPEPVPSTGQLVHPLPGARITQRFYQNPAAYARFGLPGHNGTDFGAAQGTPIRAVADGAVAWVGVDSDYGNYVRILHPDLGIHSFYAHLYGVNVRQYQSVKAGDVIGTVGSTGNSTGPHLHLEIRLDEKDSEYSGYSQTTPMPKGRIDPETYFALYGLSLSTGEQNEVSSSVHLPIVSG